jgi:hypothetical protein
MSTDYVYSCPLFISGAMVLLDPAHVFDKRASLQTLKPNKTN